MLSKVSFQVLYLQILLQDSYQRQISQDLASDATVNRCSQYLREATEALQINGTDVEKLEAIAKVILGGPNSAWVGGGCKNVYIHFCNLEQKHHLKLGHTQYSITFDKKKEPCISI